MPTTVEEGSPPMERRNSTFSYSPAEMERFRSSVMSRSTEHIRADSIDSGLGSPGLAYTTPGIAVAMKRCGSDTLKRSRRDSRDSSPFNIGEQTQLLLQKMLVLEQKLKSMETQLKNEQVQRLTLEAKVVKLEEDNEKLKSTRVKAGRQLQDFADKFYAATEAINFSSSRAPSPHPSVTELRTRSRTNSITSSSGSLTSRGSRLSAISF